jgi:hypothetical protein
MTTNTILILDDVREVSRLVRSWLLDLGTWKGMHIDCIYTEAEFKERLDACDPDNTLLMVNIAFKADAESYRFDLHGIRRIIRQGIRLTWLRTEPVLAYGTIPESDLICSQHGPLFKSNDSHRYLDLTTLAKRNPASCISGMRPIATGDELKTIINKYCLSDLKQVLLEINHFLSKEYKLQTAAGCQEFADQLVYLRRVVPCELLDIRKIDDAAALLSNEAALDKRQLQMQLRSLRELLLTAAQPIN